MGYYKKPYPSSDPSKPKRQWNPNWSKKGPKIVPGSLYKPISNPSCEQRDIIQAIVDGADSYIIDAFAGTGKTSTVCHAMHEVAKKYPSLSQSYVIYAKRNSDEAIGKADATVSVSTAHAAGLRTLAKAYGKITVDKEKTDRIAVALVGGDEDKGELRYNLVRSIDLSKDYDAKTPEEVITIVNKHGLDTCLMSDDEFASTTIKGMDMSALQPNIVSFSDMIWLVLKLGIKVQTVDRLFLDECQDLNLSRIRFVMRMLGPNSRFYGLGDRRQAIFQFTGADAHSLDTLKELTQAKELPLHRTFRCGRKIVELAQRFVPEYIADESCPEGEVREVGEQFMLGDDGATAGDFVLSRTNALTIKFAMQFLKQGKRCNIQGRDIGQGLLWMVKRSKATTVPEFQSWVDDWKTAEVERLSAKNRDYEHVLDKAECLENFCEGKQSIVELKATISSMFDDETDESKIVLSSIHKSKGLERNRVFLLENSFVCRPKTEEDRIAEANVRYVAITRCRDSLYLTS